MNSSDEDPELRRWIVWLYSLGSCCVAQGGVNIIAGCCESTLDFKCTICFNLILLSFVTIVLLLQKQSMYEVGIIAFIMITVHLRTRSIFFGSEQFEYFKGQIFSFIGGFALFIACFLIEEFVFCFVALIFCLINLGLLISTFNENKARKKAYFENKDQILSEGTLMVALNKDQQNQNQQNTDANGQQDEEEYEDEEEEDDEEDYKQQANSNKNQNQKQQSQQANPKEIQAKQVQQIQKQDNNNIKQQQQSIQVTYVAAPINNNQQNTVISNKNQLNNNEKQKF